ncbi:MAG: hypothetical protein NC408_09910, partial [Candidatus Gastranaerophilales bacterium]|nr:hypothetical protein [Candidatus Gastranaerophilales bacterium]
HAGNPYATTPANILKRNTGFSAEGQSMLNQAMQPQIIKDVQANAATMLKNSKDVAFTQARAEKYADLVIQLKDAKLPDGTARFTYEDINTILLNVRESELSNPSAIFTAIEECDKYGFTGGFGVWKCLYY